MNWFLWGALAVVLLGLLVVLDLMFLALIQMELEAPK